MVSVERDCVQRQSFSGERLPDLPWTKHRGVVASFCHIPGFLRALVHAAYQKTALTLFLLKGPCAWGIVSVCKCSKHNEQFPPLSASLIYRSAAIGKYGV